MIRLNEIERQDKRVFLITGANSGLGYETSKFYLERGAKVIMCCRDLIKGARAKDELSKFNFSGSIELLELDLADLKKVKNCAELIKKKFNSIKKRRFLYIGHTGWYKNTKFLEKLATKIPETEFAWMGGNQTLKNIKTLGKYDFSSQEAKNLIQEYDFMITLGSADANPTTILEAMAWGLIPVCSVQSGYVGFPNIRNISIDSIDDTLETIKQLQSVSEEQLIKWQRANLTELDNHFNWKRFCDQVLSEIENEESPNLEETNLKQRLYLSFAELRSPMFWGRPDNFYKFLKANFKYIFQNKL